MTIKQGQVLPDLKVKVVRNGEIEDAQLKTLMQGKKTLWIGVPGAFTPTCSDVHLPGYLNKQTQLKNKGIDQIICCAVNDPFVMRAWVHQLDADGQIIMVCDGNQELTHALGLELNLSDFGLGVRSKRYVMILDDTQVSKISVEEGGACTITNADSLLDKI